MRAGGRCRPPGEGGTAVIVGVGTDLVAVQRLRAACERRPSLRARLFSEEEWECARQGEAVHWERLAGFFAAKEAALKALGTGLRGGEFREVRVGHGQGGQPRLSMEGRAAETAARLGVRRWLVSISHTAGMAVAVVLAEGADAGD